MTLAPTASQRWPIGRHRGLLGGAAPPDGGAGGDKARARAASHGALPPLALAGVVAALALDN